LNNVIRCDPYFTNKDDFNLNLEVEDCLDHDIGKILDVEDLSGVYMNRDDHLSHKSLSDGSHSSSLGRIQGQQWAAALQNITAERDDVCDVM
jgi:hypothetical protein